MPEVARDCADVLYGDEEGSPHPRRLLILKTLHRHTYDRGLHDPGWESYCRCRAAWDYPAEERPVRMTNDEHERHLAEILDEVLP